MGIEAAVNSLKLEIDALALRISVSDKSMRHLAEIYSIVWCEACYDAYNEHTKKFAERILPHIKALNDELKFER
jgi:hypothetical protein